MGAGASKVSSGTVTVKLPTGAMIETTPTTDEAFASLTTAEVFGWQSSSPNIGTPCKASLDRHFPGSLPGSAVTRKVGSILYDKYGCVAKNTLYGQSICSDEINNEKGDLADLMKEYWGEVFPLGGIGGAPFVGKTGFMAFSHHVPDDGNVLILFGPHVGVTEAGEVGKYHRIGQKGNSTSCGAVIAAYNQCCGTTEMPFDMDDMQQSWLRQYIGRTRPGRRFHHHRARLTPRLPSLCSAGPKAQYCKSCDEPIKAATDVAYDCIKEKLLRIVNTKFGTGKLILVGGIQINLPKPYEDASRTRRGHGARPTASSPTAPLPSLSLQVRGPLPAQVLPGARRGLRARRPPPRARAAGAEEGLRQKPLDSSKAGLFRTHLERRAGTLRGS